MIPPITNGAYIFSIDFHPNSKEDSQLFATSDVTGAVKFWRLDKGKFKESTCLRHHGTTSCRVVKFSPEGENLLTGSKDGRCAYLDTNGSLKWTSSPGTGISTVSFATENTFFSGDDSGAVALWDTRTPKTAVWELGSIPVAPEEIDPDASVGEVDCDFNLKPNIVCATVGCRLIIGDIRKSKPLEYSVSADCDYLACYIASDRHVATTNCIDGAVSLFTIGEADVPLNKVFLSTLGNVNCLEPYIDLEGQPKPQYCLSGDSEGLIQLLSLTPGCFASLGTVATHLPNPSDESIGGIEDISVSSDGKIIASAGGDVGTIIFFDGKELNNLIDRPRKRPKVNNSTINKLKTDDFFADL